LNVRTSLWAVPVVLAATASADDWPSRLGPTQDGRAAATGVFRPGAPIVLAKVWSRSFDGGRAGIAIADGRVVTLAAQDERDLVLAWDAATGRELWRADLGPTHPDQYLGPGGTPALAGGRAFAIASGCVLHALDAASGKALWTLDLKERYAAKPGQGCFSSPYVRDGRLVVQTAGVEAHPRAVALDPATGTPVWQAAFADRAHYSSPIAGSLGGVAQILVHSVAPGPPPVGGLTALDPATGAVLWRHVPAASKNTSFESPQVLAPDLVSIATWNDFAVQRVVKDGADWRVEERWRSADLDAGIGPPVLHEGHLYGFGGDDLACVELATGRVRWKQRLYRGSLVLVDGHLVVLSQASGLVRVVEATPEAYREKAQLAVLSRGGKAEAPPSYAGGRIFVRNDEEIAAVTIGN
jgi:outer membrane protein assembly factor BamB